MIFKRGQLEILGLVVIVLLFSLGLLFAVRFFLLKDTGDVQQDFSRSELGSNMLNSLLKVNVPSCLNVDVGSLLKDCASVPNIDCERDGFSTKSNGVTDVADSCYAAGEVISSMLQSTFESWSVPYNFKAVIGVSNPIYRKSFNCEDLDVGNLAEFKLPTNSGLLVVDLKVC